MEHQRNLDVVGTIAQSLARAEKVLRLSWSYENIDSHASYFFTANKYELGPCWYPKPKNKYKSVFLYSQK